MSADMRSAIATTLAVCAAAAVCGCATVADDAQRSSLEALATQAPAPKPYVPPTYALDCARDPFKSLPASPLAPPGRMTEGSYMQQIHDRGELVVGVDQNTLRLAYFDPRRQRIRGLDIDLVRGVARAIFGDARGRHIRFKAISTEQRISAIVSGDVDIVASAYSINCDRLQSMYFSSVYFLARQRLLVQDDATVRSLSDLRGERVCATKGSTSIGNLEGTGVKPYPVALRTDCLVALQTGKVAAITADDSILFGFREQDPQTRIVGRCINVERYGMAINREHPEFVRFVNAVLERLGRRGLERLRRRWFAGLRAPTRGDINGCDRRSKRRVERLTRARALASSLAATRRERWTGVLAAPVTHVMRCGRGCA